MAKGFKFESYLKEIQKELVSENKKLVTKAANVVKRQARKNAGGTSSRPYKETGDLYRGIAVKVWKSGQGAYVGVKHPGQHAHLVESGHAFPKGSEKEGRVPGYPFLKPAFEDTRDKVVEILSEKRKL
jgi:HK97 gp10 family phage protein